MKVHSLIFSILALLFSSLALAAGGVFENVSGSVTVAGKAVASGAPFDSGITVETGKGAHAVMRFDDGQVTVLNEETHFVVKDYRFNKANNEGSSVFSLLKGGLRVVTGLLAKNRSDAFRLETPVATIGIRGTDFMVATGSLYLSVSQGLVSATTQVGVQTFGAGQLGFISSATAFPAAITAGQLPASVASAFSQMGAIPVTGGAAAGTGAAGTGAAAPGASVAGGVAAGGIGAGAIAAGALAVGAVAGAAGGGGGGSTTTTATSTSP